jgi:hypothetical protein
VNKNQEKIHKYMISIFYQIEETDQNIKMKISIMNIYCQIEESMNIYYQTEGIKKMSIF